MHKRKAESISTEEASKSNLNQENNSKENAEDEEGKVSLSEKEAAIYDRQIRLWGLDAQKR